MSRKKSYNRIGSLILTFAILFSFLGIETPNLSAQTTEVGPAITAAPESGQYVLVDNLGAIPTTISGSWLLRENEPADLNDAIQHAFTLNVNGDQVTLQDSTETFISGNVSSNTIATGEYQWQLRNNANGTFSFLGQGNGRILANNHSSNGFRAYTTGTADGNSDYGTEFSLHPLVTGTPDPDPIQPSLEVQNIVVEQGEEFALSDTVVNHVGELSFNYPPSLILTPVPGTDLVTTDSIGEHEIAVTASNENGEVVEYPTIEVVWAEPEVVEAPSFREEVIYSGETVLGVFAKLNDTVNLEVVRDGTVVYSGETDIETNIHVNSGKQMYIPRNNAPQAGDVIRIWVTNIHGTSEAVEKTVLDNSEILQLVADPIYRGDTKITGTVNPEATSLGVTPLVGADALGAAAQTYRFGEDGSFEITHSTLASRIIESDSLFFSASIDGQYYRLTIPTELLELEAPRIAVISDQDTSLSIFAANEGDLLRVTLPSGEVIEEPARRLGRLPVLLDAPLTAGEVVTVVTYSPNGAVSEEAAQTVIVASEQFELNVDPIYVGDQYITGTATPGSQVFVRNLGGRNVTADAEGNFSINLQGSSSDLVKDFEVEFQVRVDNKTYNAATVTVLAHTYPITLDTIGTTVGTDGEVLDLPTEAEEGETVVFRVQPNPSHYANRVRVDFGDGNRYVDIERNEDGTFSFVMPANEVKVRVSLTNFNTNFQPTRTTLDVGETEQFTFSINKGRDDVVVENPVWSIEDESVAVVDQTGLVTAVAEGETTVVFTYTVEGNELSREASVTVNPEIFTVTIDANEGTIDAEAATTEVVDGETFTVPYAFRTNLERVGHSLVGYSVEGTLLDADGVAVTEVSRFPADYTVGSDVTLTAIWEVTNGSLDLEVHDDEPHTQADRYTVTLTAEDETVFNLSTSSRGSDHARWEVEDLPNGVYTLAIDGYTITSGEKTGGDRDTVGSITVNEDGTAVLDLTYADDASSAFARFDIHGEVVRPAAPEIEVFGQHTNIIKTKTAREDGVVTIELSLADGTVITKNSNTYGNTTFFFEDLEVWPTLEVGDVVTAVAINADGVRSEVASYTVPDAYEITGLTVDPIYPSESGSTITGTVNPNAIITVHFPNGSQAVTIDDAGNWTIGSAGRRLEEGTPVNLSVVLDGETYRFFRVYETVAAPHTVTIDANGGTMNDEYVSTEVAAGETYTVPYTFQSLLSREGYTLTGYTVEGTLLDADGVAVTEISKYTAEFTPESDVTLTAVWEVTNGKFQIDLHDDEPATQADRYEVTLTAEDGTVHNLTTSSRGSEHASWEVEDVANGTYTLAIDGFAITEAVKNGHPDTVSTFTVNEDGTATVELTFEDEANSTFIRYDVHGEVQNVAEAPAAPEMTLITPLDYYVSGNAEVGNTVVVLDSEGNEIGRTEVVRTPSWQVNLPEGQVHEVGDIYSAYQIDAVTGLESELAEVTVVDDAAITQLTIDPVYVGDTSVSGTVNPEAESVTVRIDGATRSTRNIDEEGNWSVNVYSDLSDAVAGDTLDVQPRIDGKTFRYEDNAEVLALVAPRIATISDEDTSLSIVAPNEGDLVRITLPNGEVIEEVAKRFGRVPVILDAPLTAGEVVTAVTYSPNGGVSEEATATVIVASEQFELALNPIYEGDEYITGTATPGSQVFVRNLGGRNVTADADGNFSIRLFAHSSDLVEGFEVEFQVRVNDKTYGAGTEVVQALEAPRIATISDEDTSLSIVAPNEGDLVRITLPSGEVIEEVAKRFGRVPVILDAPLTAGEVVTAVTYSPNGGVSEEATATVIVASEQFDLAVDPIYEGDVYITGTATPGSQVFVRNLGGRNVTADEDGSFSIRLFAHSEDLVEGFEVEFQVRVDGKTYDAGTVEVLALPNVAEILVAEPGTRLVSGTATPGARIRLRVSAPDGTSTSSARVVGEDGTFSIEYSVNFPALADGFVVDIEDRDDNSRILDTLTIVEAGPVDLDNSTIIVTRLGAYGSRYYQAQLRLVDANGVPVEGLTQEDFEIIGFGGINNFQAEGNYYRLDTVSADELRPEYTVSMVDGVITIEIVEDKAALEIVEVDETFDGVEDFNLTTNGDVDTLEEVVVVVNGERIVLTPEQYTAVSGSTVLTIPAEVLNELGITVGDTFTVEVTQGEGEDHLAGTVSTEVTRVLPVYTLGVEIRDLDNSRTTEVTFTVTNADGEVVTGNFNEYGQWLSTEELPEGVYTITVETPEGIVAVVNDTVSTQAAVATNVENVFMMNLNEETKGTLTAVYAALILVEETEEVDTTALEEAIAEAEAVVREDFTPETVANLEAALEDARAVLANPDATQDEVDAATEALLEAIAGLVPVETEVPGEVDTSALEEAIERAEAVDTENFTPETVANLETALEEARAVLANPDATQDEVDAATQALLDAIAGLVPVETESTTTPDGTTVPEEPTPSEDDTDGTTTGEGVTQTGESSTPFMFAVLALMMAAGLVVISILRRRKN